MLHCKAPMNIFSLKFSFHRQELESFVLHLLNRSAYIYTFDGYLIIIFYNLAEFSVIFLAGFQEILFFLIYFFKNESDILSKISFLTLTLA